MVDKSPAKIRAMFDQITPRYDLLNRILTLSIDVLWRRKAASLCRGAMSVLDICCGTGDLSLELRRQGIPKVAGADFSGEMVATAKRKSLRIAQPPSFLQGDALHLSFANDSFDGVTVAFGIRNVVDPHQALLEFHRVLRPSGRVVILELATPPGRILRAGYRLYFNRILPCVGRMIARSEIDAYRYLPDSVAEWPSPDQFSKKIEAAGFRNVSYELLFMGIAAIHTGLRP